MKKLLCAGLCLLLGSSLFAEYKQVEVSLTPVFGLLNGKVIEHVIYLNDAEERTSLSRLDWEIKNAKIFGADLSIDAFKYINLNFSYAQSIPGYNIVMDDYDWMNPFTTAWLEDDPTEITNHSHHENSYLNLYSKLKIGIGANLRLPGRITIIPNAGITGEYFLMTGIGGWYEYKSYNFEHKEFPDDAKVISYEQRLEAFLLGLTVKSETIPHTFIQLDFNVAPTTTNIEALDTHIVRSTLFNDKLYNALDFEGSAKIAYMINQNLGIGFEGFIQYIPEVYGADWIGSTYSSYWTKDEEMEGGTNRLLWSVDLGCFLKI